MWRKIVFVLSTIGPKMLLLARAGLFYIKQNYTVECFSCHVQISQWLIGDIVMQKHRIANPECIFIVNPVQSGNVPYLDASSDE